MVEFFSDGIEQTDQAVAEMLLQDTTVVTDSVAGGASHVTSINRLSGIKMIFKLTMLVSTAIKAANAARCAMQAFKEHMGEVPLQPTVLDLARFSCK